MWRSGNRTLRTTCSRTSRPVSRAPGARASAPHALATGWIRRTPGCTCENTDVSPPTWGRRARGRPEATQACAAARGRPPHLYLRVALQLLLHLGLPEGLGHQGCFFQALPGGGGEVPGFPNQSRAPTRAGLRTSPHPLGLGELPPAPPGAGQNWEPPPAPPRPLSCCPGPGVSTPHGLGGGSPEGQGTPTARS